MRRTARSWSNRKTLSVSTKKEEGPRGPFLFRQIIVTGISKTIFSFLLLAVFAATANAQEASSEERAEAILAAAIKKIGGDRFLATGNMFLIGRVSSIQKGTTVASESLTALIVYPHDDRVETKSGKVKIVRVTRENSGWYFDGNVDAIFDMGPDQFARALRARRGSMDTLLRGFWRGKAKLSYIGKREATLGRRSDAIKLTYEDGEEFEFEFDHESLPFKAISRFKGINDETLVEETRFAQYIEQNGIRFPLVIDRIIDGNQVSRTNYDSFKFDVRVSDSIFIKPTDIKAFKKDLRF